jgi:nickel and cobalt resistance protein CnrR
MSPFVRMLLITITLAFVAGLGGAWLGVRLFTPAPSPSLHALVHGEMKLSTDQQVRMDRAEAQYTTEKRVQQSKIAAANRRLAEAMHASASYSPEVEAAVDEVHVALGELQKETIKYVYEMRIILTPDQAKKLDDRVFEALTRED